MNMTQQGPQDQAPQQGDIMQDILARAGLADINDVPAVIEYNWASAGTIRADGMMPLPNFGWLKVFAIFQEETEVRIYAIPMSDPPKANDQFLYEPGGYRFTLGKVHKPYVVELVRNMEVFKDEIAAELRMLAMKTMEILSDVDAEALLEEARGLAAENRINELIELLAEEDEDEDEDEDKTQPPQPTRAPS